MKFYSAGLVACTHSEKLIRYSTAQTHHDRADRRRHGVGGQPHRPPDVAPCEGKRSRHGASAKKEELLQAAEAAEPDVQVQLQRVPVRVPPLLRHPRGARERTEQRKW